MKYDREIKFNDKEACSWLLLMNLLNEDGICMAVLKEGVFFDSVYSDIRMYLINNFDVTDIWSVDAKAFENTTTKTSIIKFKKSGKTKSINFWQIEAKKYSENKFEYDDKTGVDITEYKDRIFETCEKFICKATYKQLMEVKTTWNKNNEPSFSIPCSFNMKDYKDYKVVCPKGYELKKLGEFLEYKPKSKRTASFAKENGKFRFYTSSDKIKKCDECDFDDDELKLIFGTGGVGSLFIDNKFTCSTDNFVCVTKNKDLTMYIYDYIKTNWMDFANKMFNGSTLGHINKDRLNNCLIPVPKDITKIKPQLDKIHKLHQQITTTTDLIPAKEKAICEIIKTAVEDGTRGVDYEEYKLGDVCEINPPSEKITDDYIYYLDITGCKEFTTEKIKNNSDIPSRAKRTPKINDVIISSVRPENKNINFIQKHNYKKNLVISTGFIILRSLINGSIIYYTVITDNFTNKLIDICSGSNYPSFNASDIKKLTIKIPSDKQMKKLKLNELFDEVDKLKEQLDKAKSDYQKETQILFKDFDEQEAEAENDSDSESSDDETDKESVSSSESESSESKEESSEDEPKFETITHNDREFYLEDNKVYRINKDKSKGDYYGKYKDGEVIKKLEKKILVKSKKVKYESDSDSEEEKPKKTSKKPSKK